MPYGPGPTEEAYSQKVLKSWFAEKKVSFSTIVFFETGLIGCVNQNEKMFFNKYYVFVYKRVCREDSDTKDGTEGPGPTAGRPMHK